MVLRSHHLYKLLCKPTTVGWMLIEDILGSGTKNVYSGKKKKNKNVNFQLTEKWVDVGIFTKWDTIWQ